MERPSIWVIIVVLLLAVLFLREPRFQRSEEIFLRWLDIDDSGNDHGLGVDDFSITFSAAVPEPTAVALGGLFAICLFSLGKESPFLYFQF